MGAWGLHVAVLGGPQGTRIKFGVAASPARALIPLTLKDTLLKTDKMNMNLLQTDLLLKYVIRSSLGRETQPYGNVQIHTEYWGMIEIEM